MSIQNIRIILTSILLFSAVALGVYTEYFCVDVQCYYDFERSFGEPAFWYTASLLPSFVLLLFVKSSVFKNWLKYIVSWYIPVSIFAVNQVSVNSSSILSFDRSTVAVLWMSVLFIITVIFTGVLWWKDRKRKAPE